MRGQGRRWGRILETVLVITESKDELESGELTQSEKQAGGWDINGIIGRAEALDTSQRRAWVGSDHNDVH